MSRKFTKYPQNYVRASRYAPAISDDVIYADIDWIAERIAPKLTYWTKTFGHDCYTVECAIEAFVSLNDDYADWWGRGVNTPEKEEQFVQALKDAMLSHGIGLVDDRIK